MEDNRYYNEYEQKLQMLLLEQCAMNNWMGRQLLEAEELEDAWNRIAPEYLVDAVPEIADYPLTALGWAGYIGMALAHFWDKNWIAYEKDEDLYNKLKKRGFDEMDEYITEDILKMPLGSPEEMKLTQTMQSLSNIVLTFIRKEQVEPQSKAAFHIYARSLRVLCKIGISMELYRLGYKYEKAILN